MKFILTKHLFVSNYLVVIFTMCKLEFKTSLSFPFLLYMLIYMLLTKTFLYVFKYVY